MNRVLEPFRDPVRGECNEYDETDDDRGTTIAACIASWVRARLVLDIDGHQSR